MSTMPHKYFKVRIQRVVVSQRIVIVEAQDRQGAETKALAAANKLEVPFANGIPDFAVLECIAIAQSLITAPEDQIIK